MKKIIILIVFFILSLNNIFANSALDDLPESFFILILFINIFPFIYWLWIIFIIYKLIKKEKISIFSKIVTIILSLPMIWLLTKLLPYYLTN